MSAGAHTIKGDSALAKKEVAGYNKLKQQRDRSYLLNALQGISQLGMAGAVVFLAATKTVIPVIVTLSSDGHVVQQQIVTPEALTQNEAVVQGALHRFVTACNTFDPDWRQRYADICRLHATTDVARVYEAEIAPDNPQNPYLELGDSGRRSARVTAISKLGNDSYQVFFESTLERNGAVVKTDYYNAHVRYAITRKPRDLDGRWENSIGFLATSYRKDQELARK